MVKKTEQIILTEEEKDKIWLKIIKREVKDDELKGLANNKCKKCLGRGYTGINVDSKQYQICNCVVMTIAKGSK